MYAANSTTKPFPSGANGFVAETADPGRLHPARLREAHLREALGRFATRVTVVSAGAHGDERAGYLARFNRALERDLAGVDHRILIGRVRDIELTETRATPLIFYRGQLGRRT